MPEQETKKLSVVDAFKNIDGVCAEFKGTRIEHHILTESLKLVGSIINKYLEDQKDKEAEKNDEVQIEE